MPFAFLALTILTGGDLLGNLIGIACGHIFYYLKDIVPITFRKDFLITPEFVSNYLDNPNSQLYRPSINSQGSADSFGNRWSGNNNNNNSDNRGSGPGNPGNGNSGAGSSGRGFSAFSGSGRTFS